MKYIIGRNSQQCCNMQQHIYAAAAATQSALTSSERANNLCAGVLLPQTSGVAAPTKWSPTCQTPDSSQQHTHTATAKCCSKNMKQQKRRRQENRFFVATKLLDIVAIIARLCAVHWQQQQQQQQHGVGFSTTIEATRISKHQNSQEFIAFRDDLPNGQ